MNKRIKKLWIDALRSDKYVQGQSRLRTITDDGPLDCCLGVLCDLHAKETGGEWIAHNSINFGTDSGVGYMGEYAILPGEVMQWAGLGDTNPAVEDDTIKTATGDDPSLAGANDYGYTFKQIADIIEAQL